MLAQAILYKSEIEKIYTNNIFKDKYRFYQLSSYVNFEFSVDNSDWYKLEYCSLDKNCNVIGFFTAHIERDSKKISEIGILNFIDEEKSDKHIIYGVDLHRFLTIVYNHPAINKLEWSVIVDPNNAFSKRELFYDKIVKKFNGRIVGTFTKTVKLRDDKFYDRKFYEIIK